MMIGIHSSFVGARVLLVAAATPSLTGQGIAEPGNGRGAAPCASRHSSRQSEESDMLSRVPKYFGRSCSMISKIARLMQTLGVVAMAGGLLSGGPSFAATEPDRDSAR
jgi:hypothetical protein